MSYSGTVFCGFCGKRGHNKLGCPERKKYARENPDSWVAKEVTREAELRKSRASSRACSYCGEKGHNRRGCNERKKDIKNIEKRQRSFEVEFAERCNEIGLLPGALIYHYTENHNRETLMYVESFNWRQLNFLTSDSSLDRWGAVPWHLADRRVLLARVVTDSYVPNACPTNYDRTWLQPSGKSEYISLKSLYHLFPKTLVQPSEEFLEKQKQSNRVRIEDAVHIASPIFDGDGLIVTDEDRNFALRDLESHFNTYSSKPRPRDHYYRINFRCSMWKNIYPDLHKSARAEWENK